MTPSMNTVTHRVECPSCGAQALVRVAELRSSPCHSPHLYVATFSCANDFGDSHERPRDQDLLALVTVSAEFSS